MRFDSTKAALEHGRSIRGDKQAISELKHEYTGILRAWEELNAVVDSSDLQPLLNLAFEGQFIRECIQEAEK